MKIKQYLVAFVVLITALIPRYGATAVGEQITSVSLSSNKVTPGFAMQFSLHTQANVRQNVNRSEALAIPDGWFVEISKNDSYPAGVWGVHRILLPENNLTVDDDLVYTFTAPEEESHYRFRMQSPDGNFYASEVFEVVAEPFVTVKPPRSFEQGEDVTLRIYTAQGEPWATEQWGNQQGKYNIDVYSFGNGGPRAYAAPDGSAPVRIERTAPGTYEFPASQTIGEYYVGFNQYPFISLHSTSFDVVADNSDDDADVNDDAADDSDDRTPELPPVLTPYPDTDTPTDSSDDEPGSQDDRDDDTSSSRREGGSTQFDCPLKIGKAYRAPNSSAVYFVVEPRRANGAINANARSCAKRAFTNQRAYFSYFDSWTDVIEDARIDTISNDVLGFMPKGPKYDPKYGALVKVVNDSKVYLLLGGKKYWINSETVFKQLRYSWTWVEDVSDELLATYEEGGEITDTTRHPNYTLIKYKNDSKVYRLEPDPTNSNRTVRRHIADEETFRSLGYRWDRIVTIDDSEQYTNGEELRYERRIRLEAR